MTQSSNPTGITVLVTFAGGGPLDGQSSRVPLSLVAGSHLEVPGSPGVAYRQTSEVVEIEAGAAQLYLFKREGE